MADSASESKDLSLASGRLLYISFCDLTYIRFKDVDCYAVFLFKTSYYRLNLIVDGLLYTPVCELQNDVEVIFAHSDIDQKLIDVLQMIFKLLLFCIKKFCVKLVF